MPSREQLLSAGYTPAEIESLVLLKPVGCSLCANGYKGRFALVEAMEMTDHLRKAIIGGASTIELRKAAIESGMLTLRRAGLMNAMRGVTSLEEVMRHTVGEDVEHAPAGTEKKAGEGDEAAPAEEVAKV
jgi:type IV pilus assembly protein PilB